MDLEKIFKNCETRNIIEEIKLSNLSTDNLRDIRHFITTEINLRESRGKEINE